MTFPTDDLLSAFHDGEITLAERATVEQRLATSADARRELSEFKQISALLKDLPRNRLPTEFPQQVLQAIEREMLIPSQPIGSTDSFATRMSSSRRWIGAAAVLTSAAGLLLLVRALDDRAGRGNSDIPRLAGSPPAFSSVAGGAGESPLAKAMDESASLVRSNNSAAGAAGQNALGADSPITAFGGGRIAVESASENLFFDQAALRTANVGDVVRAIQRSDGDEVAVVYLTVVDRQQGLQDLQLLLTDNKFARSEEESVAKADRISAPSGVADEMQAVLVKSDAAHLEAALTQLRNEKNLQSLEVNQPIMLAELDGVRSNQAPLADKAVPGSPKRENPRALLEPAATTRRAKSAAPETEEKKQALAATASNQKPGESAVKAKESRDSTEQFANQTRLGVSAQVLKQNQLSQQSRARSVSRGEPRSQAVAEKDASKSDDHRPMQVLFVVVDQTQAGKQQTSPAISPKPAATPAKTRHEPAKPNGQDGAA